MNIICLVPSITETLIFCDVNVIGRTRFCIHPKNRIKDIEKVGGTKDIDWQKTSHLNPDLIILDKEENTLEMANSCPYPYFTLHITNLNNISSELERLAEYINNEKLKIVAHRWKKVASQPLPKKSLMDLPGVIEWWRPVTTHKKFIYLIWKDPWMAIGQKTFIQSVLQHIGLEDFRINFTKPYPAVELENYKPDETLLLFSSEPFPFQRHKKALKKMNYAMALVDGEKFSWYGIRSLLFLEELHLK